MFTQAAHPLMSGVPMPLVLIGSDERVIAANQAAIALLGQLTPGRHYITALRQPSMLDAVEATLRSGKAQTTRHLANEAGRETTYLVRCMPINEDLRSAVMVSFEDINSIEQAGQMRRDFVANVSHELRTPLTALLGFIETLQGPAKSDPAAQDRFLTIMSSEAARMERLVKDLLSLSRVEGEERMRPKSQVDVAAILRSVLDAIGPTARAAGVSVVTQGLDISCFVTGDEDQLRQVFTNLVENAIKYGAKEGRVVVTATMSDRDLSLRGPGVRIDVLDDGEGIDAVHIPRLTERFYRVDTHRSRELGGTGLGLAIAKHIVNRHRGRLRIESERGKGSCFSVILPTNP